ncbi:metal ABC transporter substrate-binding protein [Georgenia yuyongxinii]|uniref:Metal ABC transporter substrate-binding protein n=1 Tax=Georgenia yuyongxinii TaxID=2589797 RepID=A0A5B8C2X2_9MICO|nr:metal ABC transporter substrate-binding protein [Georgenia yuyongxinii]QDC23881.1 metal ABC transporter substrate-binding protein [Georgenia yuyongxinii]
MPKRGSPVDPQNERRGAIAGAAVAGAAVVLGLLLAGCAGPATDTAAATARTAGDDRPLVLTTFTVLADMTRNVAGDLVRVESVTDVGAEIHGYEPTPEDLARAAGADLVLDNGLGLEAWFAQFITDVDAQHVVLTEGVDPVPIAGEDKLNPHAWMSPVAGQTYVANIAKALSGLDPVNAETYAANADAYTAELDALHGELVDALASLPPDERVLVTCEGAFSYLARDVGLTEAYLWPVNSERQSTPRQVAAVIDRVRADEVPAVFCESTVNQDGQRQVAAETGARFGGTLYVDSLSGPDGPVPTYLDLLRHDAGTIVAGLTAREERP